MTESHWKYLTLNQKDRVLTVRFEAQNKVNSLNRALMRELTELAHQLQDDSELNAIIITGQPSIFSGGMDLKDPELGETKKLTLAQRRKHNQLGPKMCAAWEALEPVTIAAIESWCIGGAAALAVSCDWRVAAQDAQIYVPELKLGMNMSWQSVPRFVNLIGPSKTKKLLLLAEPLSAQNAESWGLVDYLVPSGEAVNKASELATKLGAMPPIPLRMAKQAINVSANALSDATSHMDADQFLLTQETDDAKEGVRAFFEKRPAKFEGN
jgi:enoyl-CoA hydratase/carnithine racemase